MRAPFLALVLVAALGGCSTLSAVQNFTVTQTQVDSARSAYDAAFLAPAANYRNLGYCATGTKATFTAPCADRDVVKKLRAADAAVNKAFDNVQGLIDSGNNTGLSAAYDALQSAITAAKAILAQTSTGAV